ncbi:MAG TPA: hypothetical protein VHC22_19005 [Pirellulales bacterium]|nr:hypothetical protein [Pirellulales bacterium]
MPQTRDIALEELTASGDALGVAGTRVDAAHSLGDALVALPPLAQMPVEQAITDLVRVEGAVQLQAHADQLGAFLRQRQQELDRREAQLNARLADFAQEVRDARLWLSQRNDELNDREAKLAECTAALPAELAERVLSPPADRIVFDPSAPMAGSTAPPEGGDKVTDPQETLPHFPDSPGPLDEGEWKDVLARQSVEIDQRRISLEKFREEVSQMHREALELRLAAEEAQSDLLAALGSEAADAALSRARGRLAGHFRDEAAELARRREELESLKSDLAAEHARLEQRWLEIRAGIGAEATVV